MISTNIVLERVTRVAALGLRFWDEVSGRIVYDGLDVVAFPASNPALIARPIITPSGVFAFVHLPGLRDVENGNGDAAFWANLPALVPFLVQVVDYQGRFQPCQLAVQVPVRGLAALECGSPPLFEDRIPLFSAPARQAPGGMAVLHSDLWDAVTGVPAAYARLQAEIDGRLVSSSFADQNGRITLIFGYPEPAGFTLGSPLSGRRALSDQTWTVQLRAFYTPLAPVPVIPDLCQVLNQAETNLFLGDSPAQFLTETTIEFGKEAVLKSQSQSVLLIAPV